MTPVPVAKFTSSSIPDRGRQCHTTSITSWKTKAPNLQRLLSGLIFNSTYSYRLAVENAGGSLKWTSSANFAFTTLAGLSAPTLGDVNASNTVSL